MDLVKSNLDEKHGLIVKMDQEGTPAPPRETTPQASPLENLHLLLPVDGANLLSVLYPSLARSTDALVGGLITGFEPPPYEYSQNDPPSYQPLFDAAGDISAPSPYRQVLTTEGRSQVKESEYTDSETLQCPITLKDIKAGDMVATLPCGHKFDPSGLCTWLEKYDAKCPVCRCQLPSEERRAPLEPEEQEGHGNETSASELSEIVRSLARMSLARRQERYHTSIMQSLFNATSS